MRSLRPLRILVANWLDAANPRAGGAELHLHRVFGGMAARGHQVTVVSSGWSGAPTGDRADGLRIVRTGGRYSYLLSAPRTIRRLIREEGADLLVEDLNKVPLFTPLWAPVPVGLLVHHLFGRTAFREGGLLLGGATWLLERPIPAVYRGIPTVAVSPSTRDDLVHRGLDPGSVQVVPNGIDAEAFVTLPGAGRDAEPALVYLGRLNRYKGIDLALRAVARLRDEGLAVRFRIAGKGPARGELERLTRKLHLDDRVEFLGFVPDREKRSLLARSWIHLLPSEREGWGITVVEAGAAGTPTIASEVPGLRDTVEDGRTGLLVPHGSVGALAGAIGALVRDPERLDRMGEEAWHAARRYSWEESSRAIEAWARGIAERAGPLDSDPLAP